MGQGRGKMAFRFCVRLGLGLGLGLGVGLGLRVYNHSGCSQSLESHLYFLLENSVGLVHSSLTYG